METSYGSQCVARPLVVSQGPSADKLGRSRGCREFLRAADRARVGRKPAKCMLKAGGIYMTQ